MNTKQVIVIRKDLKMRRGKEIAQGSHASMAFLTSKLKHRSIVDRVKRFFFRDIAKIEQDWLNNSFTKVTVQVNSEEELFSVYHAARGSCIEAHIICDNGLTEFGGVRTYTCCAIGPDQSERIDLITKNLKLY